MAELISRDEAMSQGLKRYYTGEPCMRGHVDYRKVDSGSCCECSREYTRAWRASGNVAKDFKVKELPSQEYLLQCFEYEIATGKLFWKQRPSEHFESEKGWRIFNSKMPGKEVGYKHKNNQYVEVRLDNKLHKAHRIIYKMVKGLDSTAIIDHIDGDSSNNRIENLREVTAQQSAWNKSKNTASKTSQYKGVFREEEKWVVYKTWMDSIEERFYFDTEMEAAIGYDKIVFKQQGQYARLNFPELVNQYV